MNKYKPVIATAMATVLCSTLLACLVEYLLNVVGMRVAVIGVLTATGFYSICLLLWLILSDSLDKNRLDVEDVLYSFRGNFRYVGYPAALTLIAFELLKKPEFMPVFESASYIGSGLGIVIYLVLIVSNEFLSCLFFEIFDRYFQGELPINRV